MQDRSLNYFSIYPAFSIFAYALSPTLYYNDITQNLGERAIFYLYMEDFKVDSFLVSQVAGAGLLCQVSAYETFY